MKKLPAISVSLEMLTAIFLSLEEIKESKKIGCLSWAFLITIVLVALPHLCQIIRDTLWFYHLSFLL